MKPTDVLADAHATIATLVSALSTANARIRELEALAGVQNLRIVEVMKLADDAESRYGELHVKWQLARRESAAARASSRKRAPADANQVRVAAGRYTPVR